MPFAGYASRSLSFVEELIDALDEDGEQTLLDLLAKMDIQDWEDWRSSHVSLIYDFVAATSSRRRSLKKFQKERPLLILAGIQHCIMAEAFLRKLDDHCWEHMTYRQMTAGAGYLVHHIRDSNPDYGIDVGKVVFPGLPGGFEAI